MNVTRRAPVSWCRVRQRWSKPPCNTAWTQQPNWHAECSLSSPPQQVLLSLLLYIHSPALFQLNNKKLFSLACYLTAVLWIDGCVHTHAWQLLCTPNEFNHRARCQHVISSLCLLGERWNCSGWSGEGRKRDGGRSKVGKKRLWGGTEERKSKYEDVWRKKEREEQEEGRREIKEKQAWRTLSGCLNVSGRQTRATCNNSEIILKTRQEKNNTKDKWNLIIFETEGQFILSGIKFRAN